MTANEYAVSLLPGWGRILDFGEGFKNLLTWTHPERLCFYLGVRALGCVICEGADAPVSRAGLGPLPLATGRRLADDDASSCGEGVPHDRALRTATAREGARAVIEHEAHEKTGPAPCHLVTVLRDGVSISAGGRTLCDLARAAVSWLGLEKDVGVAGPARVLVLLGHAGLAVTDGPPGIE